MVLGKVFQKIKGKSMGYVSDWEKRELKSIKFITKKELKAAIKKPKTTNLSPKLKPPIEIINIHPKQSKLTRLFSIRRILRKAKYERD